MGCQNYSFLVQFMLVFPFQLNSFSPIHVGAAMKNVHTLGCQIALAAAVPTWSLQGEGMLRYNT
jgi:hypothetical protein